ncbi:hypothetical protein BDR03DRAFT_263964 [Suillus americanus]|nr:hypothetical protein BDR03DRAFT_263964 [Suillus americanus]
MIHMLVLLRHLLVMAVVAVQHPHHRVPSLVGSPRSSPVFTTPRRVSSRCPPSRTERPCMSPHRARKNNSCKVPTLKVNSNNKVNPMGRHHRLIPR